MTHRQQPKTLIQVFSDDWLPHSSLFTNQHSRGFISESGVVFNFVQRASKCQELLNHSEMIKASRKYRSVIHSWYIKILDDMSSDKSLSQETKRELSEQSKVLHKMEIAWHICEILYINVSSTGTLLVQLLNWIKWHFTYYVEIADQMIISDLPQMHQHYWDVIMFFALRGDMEHASLFLELHSESKTDPAFIVIGDLLKKFPLITSNVVIHEYYLRWGFWNESVIQAIQDQRISQSNKQSHIQLNLLLKLLSGDLESFKTISYLFHSWYQMMVSYALFTDPCLKGDIDALIEKIIDVYYSSSSASQKCEDMNQPSMFDKLIRSSFNYDLIEVIKQSSMCFDDAWWFVTHFVDLIYNSARYADYQITDIGLIRDSFVLNYANSLFARRKQFWQLSIEYLIHAGKDSQHHILTCLERVPFNSERELQRLLTTCRRFGFHDLELSLCRQQSRKWLRWARLGQGREHKYGSALFWAIRSKDKMLINYIVDQFLQHYLRKSSMSISTINDAEKQPTLLLDEDMIENIGGSIVLSERLIFLCKYHEFHQLCRRNEYKQAAKILVDDMLTSNAIPDFFQFQVIKDCLPLLQLSSSSSKQTEHAEVFMNSEQTCKVISSLEHLLYRIKMRFKNHKNKASSLWDEYFTSESPEDIEGDETSIETLNQKQIEQFENKLRVAAAYNLSKNFVIFNNNYNMALP